MFLCVCFSPMTSRAHIQPGKTAPGMQRGENAGPQSQIGIQRSLGPGPRHSLGPGLGLLAPDAQHGPQPHPRGQDGAGGAGHGGRPGPPAHQGGSGQARWGGRPAALVHGWGLCRCQRCVAAALSVFKLSVFFLSIFCFWFVAILMYFIPCVVVLILLRFV